MFILGKKYNRNEIHEMLGGAALQGTMPTSNGEVVCLLANKKVHPNAPYQIELGSSEINIRRAFKLLGKKESKPVFVSNRSGEWIYKGLFMPMPEGIRKRDDSVEFGSTEKYILELIKDDTEIEDEADHERPVSNPQMITIKEPMISVYVEDSNFDYQHDSLEKTSLIDFENTLAVRAIEANVEYEEYDPSMPSMSTLSYNPEKYKGLKTGSWYSFPISLVQSVDPLLDVDDIYGGTTYLRSHIALTEGTIDFSNYLISPRWIETENVEFNADFLIIGDISLEVVDCGQGNWNEIHSDDFVMIYDTGASHMMKRWDIQQLVKERLTPILKKQKVVIISHWDIDHYQSLLTFDKGSFDNVQAVVGPSQVPRTLTYERVKKIVEDHSVPFRTIPPSPRSTGSRKIDLNFHSSIGPFRFYRAVDGKSRNQTGIVVSVIGDSRTAILTGDHHYDKILDALGTSQPSQKETIMVTPHHGGNAGKIDIPAWMQSFPQLQTPVSVGENWYKHPLKKTMSDLTLLQRGIAPKMTKTEGDRSISYKL